MAYYVQIDAAATAVSVAEVSGEIDAPHMIPIGSLDASILGCTLVDGQWVPPEPVPTPLDAARRISVLAFRRRFTLTERAALEWAAVDRADQSTEQRQQAALLRAMFADQAAAAYIDLDDADTVQGVQNLETMGLIAVGRAPEILGAPVQPQELP